MKNYSDKIRTAKRKRLITWLIRQSIAACIVIPFVYRWPDLKWLLPVWIILALASLFVILILFQKLENQMGNLVSELTTNDDPVEDDPVLNEGSDQKPEK